MNENEYKTENQSSGSPQTAGNQELDKIKM
jgi:hypothetical protein